MRLRRMFWASHGWNPPLLTTRAKARHFNHRYRLATAIHLTSAWTDYPFIVLGEGNVHPLVGVA